MAPGHGGKRKRGERSWSNDSTGNDSPRPSPHRPGSLNMAHHLANPSGARSSPSRDGSEPRDNSHRRSSRGGGRPGSRRGSHDSQSFSSSQHIEPGAMSHPSVTATKETTQTSRANGDSAAPQPTPSPAPVTPATRRPSSPPPPYAYEFVTDNVVEEWTLTGKQKVVDEGTAARVQQDLARLASVYQELLRSAIYGRLSPLEAGTAVKEIIGEEETSPDIDMEGIKTGLDPRSLFLDILSIMTDADTSNLALKPLVFATGISPSLMRLQLDTPLLQSLGLVRETFARMGIRKQTNLLYRQSNYNLLREESEGYSKLLTELFTTSNNEPPSSDVVEDTFERVKAMIGAFDMDVGRVLDVTLDVFAAVLVKQYRFFVKLLRASSWWPTVETSPTAESRRGTGLPNWALPGSGGWVTTEEDRAAIVRSNEQRDREFWDRVREVGIRAFFEIGRKPLSEDELKKALPETTGLPEGEDATKAWIEETGTLPPKGNRVAAQLLGFKLRFYSSSARSKSDVLPDNLIYLAALLIKVGFISLRDLYAHLWRPDDSMDTLKTEKMEEKAERERAARPGGGINALMTAGALSDDTLPTPRMRESESRATPSKDQESDKAAATKAEDELPDPKDQKVLLLKSLLVIGAIPESLFVMSKFPWLLDLYPELPDFIHRILHHSLSKVYTPLRPLSFSDDFSQQQQILNPDQSGVVKGQLRLTSPPARRTLRWAQLDKEDTNDATDYRFYWDDWADNIPICQSVDDVFALCSSFLNLSGHKIGEDASLLTKLARIGKDSLAKDGSDKNRTRWRDLLKRLLLPAVSLTKANPGVVNEVFDLLSFYPREVRYNMYAEWYQGQTSRLPDIKSAFDLARAETKDVLKRLSKTNIKPMARALAKIAYANPGIVINVAISQIESYENLIEVVVECARYFTNLGYDILTWSLINSLGQKGRSRVQEGGLLASRWLNALSTFAGRTFKRYSVMDPAPVLQYVVEQLRQNNSTDLIILEQMISSMAGIITDTNFNDAQIQAMAGGEVLQSQTILQLLDKRHESKITSRRLLKSLTHTRLAGQVLVAIAQERLTCVYNESTSELKLLGNIFDEIHRILTQYLDLLRSNLSVEEFDSFVPDFSSLIKDFGIQPEIAFWIRRVSVSKKITDIERQKQETEAFTKQADAATTSKPADENKMDTAEDSEAPAKTEEASTENAMDVDKEEKDIIDATEGNDSNPAPLAANPVMQELMDNVKSVLPSETWDVVGVQFYATFWQLSLYDVHVPQKSYEDEIDRQKRRIVVINNDRSDLSLAGTQRKDREKRQITQLQDRILEENKSHLKAYGHTRNRLQKEKDRWFAGMRLKHDALNVALLEQCLLPRLLLSPLDAFFCFKMLKFLHSSGTPNFRTVGLLDQLFRDQRLTALIFLCTSKEADNLGRFLNEILRDLSRWHSDKAIYEKEAFGAKRDLPGFAKNVDPEGTPVKFLEFEDFRRLLYKWHRLLANALKTCLNGGEYMHIRNAISVLKAVVQHFPAVNWIGRDMLTAVNTLSKTDERDDVKIPAASLIGDLNRREKKWMLPQEFNLVQAQAGAGQGRAGSTVDKPGTSRPQSATPTPLNAAATEFKPPSGAHGSEGAAPKDRLEVEDGEIEDAKMADVPAKETEKAASTSQIESTADTSPAAMDTSADDTPSERPTSATNEPPVRPRPGSRADSGRQGSERPDFERSASNANFRQQNHRPGRPPRHSDGRLPPRPELMDDRRDRHPDFGPGPRGRHGGGPDHGRPFDGPMGDPRGPVRINDRDRDFLMRPPLDDPMHGPGYRDGRLPRDPDWPAGRSGRVRPDGFHEPDLPPRGDLMPERHDRMGDGPRRGPGPGPGPSSQRSNLPNRPDRLPPRHEDFPRGPRSDRLPPESRAVALGLEGPRQVPESQPDIPSGPRGQNARGNARGRNVSGQQPPPSTPSNGPGAHSERPGRQQDTGRQVGRGGLEQSSAAPPSPTTGTSGIHPDRLKHIVQEPPSAAPMAPPSGPRGGTAPSNQAIPRGPQGSGGDRRGDKRFLGINHMLQQQTGGPVDRTPSGPSPRGRGSRRDSESMNIPSPQSSNRPPMGAGPPGDDGSSRSRASGGSRGGGDLIDDAGSETRRSGRTGDRERDRKREGGDSTNINGGSNRRDDNRERHRDHERERSRRSDPGGGGAGREDIERDQDRPPTEPRESLRRVPSSREELRRRDRRERDTGPADAGDSPAPSANNPHEQEGRLRPPSSMGAPRPPPPPPPPGGPPPPDENDRRRNAGGDRGGRSDNRDRERERRGERRERDHRDGASGPGHRKRGRPGAEEGGAGAGDGGRGMRTGSENKRPRRGA
ncbi:hypothetical protein N7510_003063 [Penicillium lagena]|uniref:uncharacterized protein n=1 Tax=Penicillium lagena TaxID=94218 RepID=UPI002540A595|nr:uncharacterized protein N7510_003063 [Penicillium lagena]KAJ5619079.1 hypothetical protein N7510_003063 [Penicillium lagena]